MSGLRSLLLLGLCKLVRMAEPVPPTWDETTTADFEELYRRAVAPGTGGWVDYTSHRPKHEFLTYLLEHHAVLLHGSGNREIQVLEPRQQTLFDGRMTRGVFASTDAIWSLFFATVPRPPKGVRYSLRNGAVAVRRSLGRYRKFYFFSVSDHVLRDHPWGDGAVYIVPRDPFRLQSETWQEWTSPEPIRPLAKLAVSPDDFPLRHLVGAHGDDESQLRFYLRHAIGLR